MADTARGADDAGAASSKRLPDSTSDAVEASAGRAAGLLPRDLSQGRAAPILVAALITWAITVAPVGFGRGASIAAGLVSVLALGAGLGGGILLAKRPALARHLGISAFLGFATLTWLANPAAIHPLRLDPIRGAFGALAWSIFALAWSERWGPRARTVPADLDAPSLLARSSLAPLAQPIAALGVVASLVYLVLAFRVRDPDRALVAQALALACSVAVVTAASTVATARGKPR
ncbi:MAG: hypothetical protein ACMG6S_23580, partial [Byssovorax sp.]